MSGDQNFELRGSITYSQQAVLGPPDTYTLKVTTKERTTIKQVISSLTQFGVKVSAGYSTESKGGFSLPIKALSVSGEVSTKMTADFESAFKRSTSQTNSTETEKSYEREETIQYKGEAGKMKYIFLEKYLIGGAVYKSQIKIAFDEEGESLKDKSVPLQIKGILGSAFFKLKNGNGHFLAVAGNDLKNYIPCVWTETGETGQRWIWEGSHIRSALGSKYLAVREDSGSKGAEVILWTKTSELGQQWMRDGSHIRSGKGHYLAVPGNGGKGSSLCVWTKTNEGGQKWSFV